jgi:hypothetical protein
MGTICFPISLSLPKTLSLSLFFFLSSRSGLGKGRQEKEHKQLVYTIYASRFASLNLQCIHLSRKRRLFQVWSELLVFRRSGRNSSLGCGLMLSVSFLPVTTENKDKIVIPKIDEEINHCQNFETRKQILQGRKRGRTDERNRGNAREGKDRRTSNSSTPP